MHSEHSPALIAAISLAGPVLFALIWVGVVNLLAWIGGWSRLAQDYRSYDDFGGALWRFQYGWFGGVRYKGVLTFGTDAKGLYLSVLVLFRPGHPPLLVPWRDLSIASSDSDWIVLRFRATPGVTLKLGRQLGEKLLAGRTIAPAE
jgi:hypothetical protein